MSAAAVLPVSSHCKKNFQPSYLTKDEADFEAFFPVRGRLCTRRLHLGRPSTTTRETSFPQVEWKTIKCATWVAKTCDPCFESAAIYAKTASRHHPKNRFHLNHHHYYNSLNYCSHRSNADYHHHHHHYYYHYHPAINNPNIDRHQIRLTGKFIYCPGVLCFLIV
ncbi:hypothetical protein RvY_03078 [Ramazzottius varieornatus]|uniref:Uncharacterized protein n=1 Tax=Ramazzottius varieornatus TaxID=947166 RepID=A0A1D1UQ68_RAMVA|nr:hypothetical protein RvY_03046 [Ramazzottius varieornatus]GAU90698.1 hypothetical protein RvY_03078 [Ramazzottius varieornatus]